MTVVVVTGTNTSVGKTVATAALAARAADRGSVCVVKPVQTGVRAGEPGDVDDVRRLTGLTDVVELTRLADPLAPDSAARLRDVSIPPVREYAEPIVAIASRFDSVLIEGAGGVLVRLDTDGGTIVDLALALLDHDIELTVLVVAAAGLGTLNHTELTVAAVRARGLEPAGLVIGSWPSEPGLAERCNLDDLPRVTGVPVVGVIPAGAGGMEPPAFAAGSRTWLNQSLSRR